MNDSVIKNGGGQSGEAKARRYDQVVDHISEFARVFPTQGLVLQDYVDKLNEQFSALLAHEVIDRQVGVGLDLGAFVTQVSQDSCHIVVPVHVRVKSWGRQLPHPRSLC